MWAQGADGRQRTQTLLAECSEEKSMSSLTTESLLSKVRALRPEHLREVAAFIDLLQQRAHPTADRKQDFPVIHVGRWPDELGLRREDWYGDDGR
jgi:hypothetical protein